MNVMLIKECILIRRVNKFFRAGGFSMSAITAYSPFLNLISSPITLLSKSGPFNSFSFDEMLLCVAAASKTTLILPGLFGFNT